MSDNTRRRAPRGGYAIACADLFSCTDELASRVDGIAAGGARRDRTDDLLLAKQALSQLSYGPAPVMMKLGYPGIARNGGPGKI